MKAITITSTNRNVTTVIVCRYVEAHKAMSQRATARALNIHHRTWQRYLSGETSPDNQVKARIARLMGVGNYLELVQQATKFYK